jgi:ABC-type spermidine/putrescine transport system permease subunit II
MTAEGAPASPGRPGGSIGPSGVEAGGRDPTPPARRRIRHVAVAIVAGVALVFLCLPILVVVPMSFSSARSLRFPPPGVSLRWYQEFFADPEWLVAMTNSMVVAAASSALAVVLGVLAAYGLVRGRFAGRAAIEATFMAPLVIPSVIVAIALYIAFAQVGLLGTYAGLIVAHTIHSAPYVVLVMSVAVASFDERIEQMARSLGAPERTVLLRVILPNVLPSIVAAWILAFIVSFDEVILTLFLFGNKYTIPKQMFIRLELQIDPTITAIATMLIVLSVATLVAAVLLSPPLRSLLGLRRDQTAA